MTALILKYLFAVCLSGLPFLKLRGMVRKNERLSNYVRWFNLGMKRYKSFRKFYILMLIISVISIQFIDLQASENIMGLIVKKQMDYSAISYTTPTFISFLCFVITMFLFNYKIADKLLMILHQNRVLFWSVALYTMVITIFLGRLFVVAEILSLIMMASMYYPIQIHQGDDGNRKPVRLLPFLLNKAA